MSWRRLLILPLAALCLGDPATAPRLRPPIPEKITGDCAYEQARRYFLLAYAYRREKPAAARYFCGRALGLARPCGGEAEPLRARAERLCDIPIPE